MIRAHLDLDHDKFYCPVTGQAVLGPEHLWPSPATAFVFVDEAGEFEHITDQFQKIDGQANARQLMEDDPWDRFNRFCKAIEKEPTLVIFSITTHGMACGPVNSTVHIGIEMNWSEAPDETTN